LHRWLNVPKAESKSQRPGYRLNQRLDRTQPGNQHTWDNDSGIMRGKPQRPNRPAGHSAAAATIDFLIWAGGWMCSIVIALLALLALLAHHDDVKLDHHKG
jgi:hypothetical protein